MGAPGPPGANGTRGERGATGSQGPVGPRGTGNFTSCNYETKVEKGNAGSDSDVDVSDGAVSIYGYFLHY